MCIWLLSKTTSVTFYRWWLKNFFWFHPIKSVGRSRVKRIRARSNRARDNRVRNNRVWNNHADSRVLKFQRLFDDFFIVWGLVFIWKHLFIIRNSICIFVIFDVDLIAWFYMFKKLNDSIHLLERFEGFSFHIKTFEFNGKSWKWSVIGLFRVFNASLICFSVLIIRIFL